MLRTEISDHLRQITVEDARRLLDQCKREEIMLEREISDHRAHLYYIIDLFCLEREAILQNRAKKFYLQKISEASGGWPLPLDTATSISESELPD